jgi:2-hydroxychromene-2-carboxylate isomerase/predicted enzyme related to lactoylglutathione lyase
VDNPRTNTLLFYFDFLSPYAYLAWTQVHGLVARYEHEVDPAPVLLAALLDANGQKGPAEIPRKRAYTLKDVTRTADRLGVPLAPPASHPFNPLLALRVASADLPRDKRCTLVSALFSATWAKRLDVTSPEIVARVATETGFDGSALVEWARSSEAKEKVRMATARALDAGAFGVPTMVVSGELFWGVDSLANIERRFQGKDPTATWPKEGFEVSASASRRAAAKGPFHSTRDIILRTRELERAARFYEETLGFRPTILEAHLGGFETGAFQLFVEEGGTKPTHPAVFELRTRDMKAQRDALLRAGCTVVEEDASVPRLYLVDPFGFIFNLEAE